MTILPAFLINSAQCRAARGLLGWTQSDLAREAKLSKTSIVQFETALADSRNETVRLITQAFMRYGIEFMPPNGVNRRAADCRLFNNETTLAQDWPVFLQSLVQEGHSQLTLYNWPDFAAEFTAQTGIHPAITHDHNKPFDRAALVGPWLILPILGSIYRLALYQAFETDVTTHYC